MFMSVWRGGGRGNTERESQRRSHEEGHLSKAGENVQDGTMQTSEGTSGKRAEVRIHLTCWKTGKKPPPWNEATKGENTREGGTKVAELEGPCRDLSFCSV